MNSAKLSSVWVISGGNVGEASAVEIARTSSS